MEGRAHRGEEKELSFNFAKQLKSGDSLVESPAPTVRYSLDGVDKTAEFGNSDPEVSDTYVLWTKHPAADSPADQQAPGDYELEIVAHTTLGEKLHAEVRAAAGYRAPILRLRADPVIAP